MAQNAGRCGLHKRRAPPTMAPGVGFEPTTDRLTVDCSTAELPRNGRCAVERPRVIATSPRSTKIFFRHARRVRDAWLVGPAFVLNPVASHERQGSDSVAVGCANRKKTMMDRIRRPNRGLEGGASTGGPDRRCGSGGRDKGADQANLWTPPLTVPLLPTVIFFSPSVCAPSSVTMYSS